MSRRLKLNASILLISGVALAGIPASALAGGSGGSGFGPGTTPATGSSGSSTPTGTATPVATVQTAGNGISLRTSSATVMHSRLRITGQVDNPGRSQIVEVERRSGSSQWLFTAHTAIARNGTFAVSWPTNHSGRYAIRVVIGSSLGSISQAAAASPSLTVTVYKSAIATYYGPGEWGSQTACGQTLRHSTLGVANRTLPCGTKVSLMWHGRTIVVPVIDRGPYANHADWDLTEATASKLGISDTETIGAATVGH